MAVNVRVIVHWGHGIVFPRRDSRSSRPAYASRLLRQSCGGLAFCPHCMYDFALLECLAAGLETRALNFGMLCRADMKPFWHNYHDGLDPQVRARILELFDTDPLPKYLRG